MNAWCKPTVYEINAGSLINVGAWHNIHVTIIAPTMTTKRGAYTSTTKLQTVEVADKTSKEAAAMSAKNFQLTVSTATNTTNTP